MKQSGAINFSKLQSVLQDVYDSQDWIAKEMKGKTMVEVNKKKKQKYLKAFFAALGGLKVIEETAKRLGVKVN